MNRRRFLQQASCALLTMTGGAAARAQRVKPHVYSDPVMLGHEPPADHPESPKRLETVMGAIRRLERDGALSVATPKPATDDDLLLVHTADYVKTVRAEIAAGRRTLSTGDTDLSPGSLAAALAAAGTVVSAVDAVMTGAARTAFCAVRPPGHHASQSRGMGFCLFNNIAIGARRARRRHAVDRILIADWDVHHGNGTQNVFYSDGSVLFFDIHQHPWYPGTGSPDESGDGQARGLIVNNPFPAGSGRREIVGVFRERLVRLADAFKPQLVMISAGFDSRAGDPLGRLTLTDQDFADLTDIVIGIARQHAGGRIVSVLEGGYSIEGLPRAVTSHLTRLAS
ncbi:MAG TPA: histone deacetylase [Vicinamibacterales bacterium]|nr:histone deacetylase [Vicinamibacterales bacterium]